MPTAAIAVNRKEVIRFARQLYRLQLLSDFFGVLLTYPFQIGRVKHLSKKRKVTKTLQQFLSLNEAERQRFLDKQERFFNS